MNSKWQNENYNLALECKRLGWHISTIKRAVDLTPEEIKKLMTTEIQPTITTYKELRAEPAPKIRKRKKKYTKESIPTPQPSAERKWAAKELDFS